MRTISGIVYSGWDQEPIPGAHLILELNVDGEYYPLGDGTTTDANGFYSFTFVPGGLNNERIKITHIAHEDGQLFPHLMSESDGNTYLQSKSHQVASPVITGWISHNSNFLWAMIILLLIFFVIVYETNGSIKWFWR